jgi:8-amino-7-oxononanoate synthase
LSGTTHPPHFESPPGPVVRIDGSEYVYFGGTAYLGLQAHPEVIAAASAAVTRYGVHCATSRLRAGVSPPVVDTEAAAAEFFGTDTAVYCASGYLAPWLLLQPLVDQFDVLLLDDRAHSCLQDAAACAGLPRAGCSVDDLPGLERQVARCAAEGLRPLLLTDGVFSATGELAPLEAQIRSLNHCPGSGLLVDDAHGFGVIGPAGRGSLDVIGQWSAVNRLSAAGQGVRLFACGTLGKALGGYGGIVPCDRALAARIHERSNVWRGAAPPAAPVAAASAQALALARREPERRRRLASNVAYMRQGLARLCVEGPGSCAPICALRGYRGWPPVKLHDWLIHSGIYAPLVRAYGGVGDEGVLRIALSSDHEAAQMDTLLAALDRLHRV